MLLKLLQDIEAALCEAIEMKDGLVSEEFIGQAGIGDGPGGHLFPHYLPVHVSGLVPAGVAAVQVGIAGLQPRVRGVHGLAVNLEQIGQCHVRTHLPS